MGKKRFNVLLTLTLFFFMIFNVKEVWALASGSKVVIFKDKNLESEVRIEIEKPKGSITVKDMQKLEYLSEGYSIKDLTGLEYATNLKVLCIEEAQLTSLKPLKGLKKLTSLYIGSSKKLVIKDLDTILPTLTNLKHLELINVPVKSATLSKLPYVEYYRLENNELTDINFIKSNKNMGLHFVTVGNQIADFTPLKGKSVNVLTILDDNKLNTNTLKVVDKVNKTIPTIMNLHIGGKSKRANINVEYLPSALYIKVTNVNSIKIGNEYYTNNLEIEGAGTLDLKSIVENYRDIKGSEFEVKSISINADKTINYDNMRKIDGKPVFIDARVNKMEDYNVMLDMATKINKNNPNVDISVHINFDDKEVDYSKIDKSLYNKVIEEIKQGRIDKLEIFKLIDYGNLIGNNLEYEYNNETGELELGYELRSLFGSNITEGFKIYDENMIEIVNKGLNYDLDDDLKSLMELRNGDKGIKLMITPDFKYVIGLCRTSDMDTNYFVIDMNKVIK